MGMVGVAAAMVALALFAPGCGGGGGGGGSVAGGSTVAVHGVANLGVVQGGVVRAYRLDGGGKGALLDRYSGTGPGGGFTLRISNYQGPMLLELTPGGQGATFLDEYTGTTAALSGTIRAVVPAVVADQYANITPLTEMAAAGALQKIAAGGDPAAGVMEALAQVGSAFLGGGDPLTLIPDDVTLPASGDADRAHYAAVLAGIAGLAHTRGKSIPALAADLYGQLFPVGGSGALSTTDLNDLYTHMIQAPVTGRVDHRPAVAGRPLGSANIAQAHQGRFEYVTLTLAVGGRRLERGVVDLYTTSAAMFPRDLYVDGTAQAPASGRVGFDTYSLSADGRWSLDRVTSAVAEPQYQGAFSADGQMVAGVLTDNYSLTEHRLLLGVRHTDAPVVTSAVWQWVGLEYGAAGALTTFSGNLDVTASSAAAGAFSGGITASDGSRPTFNGNVVRDSYGFVFTLAKGSAPVPVRFRFVPSEDGRKALIWFADGTVWGVGVALRRNSVAQPLVGRRYHYVGLAASTSVRSTAGFVHLLPGGGLFSGRDFTTAPQPQRSGVSFTLSMQAADRVGLRAVSLSKGGEAALSGFIAPDGTVVVAEDPGRGIRLLLRQ
ncbi:MAG: hypothetical protein D6682_02935 [Zetaproteobacteria bacterium]|nr:MAG: hypothetical protein D6682_02935 [Zetaproteobacteria bacterium]